MADKQEIIDWWPKIEPSLHMLSKSYIKNIDSAADLVQEVAFYAVLRMNSFNDINHLRRWAMKRLHWLALDYQRYDKFAKAAQYNEDFQPVKSNIEDHLLLKKIKTKIEALPPRQKDVLIARLNGESDADVSKRLGIETSTVRSLLRHARHKIASDLAEMEE